MKNHLIQVVTASPKMIVGNVSRNADEMIALIRKMPEAGLITFPELAITGYTCADLFLSDLLLNEAESALLRIAKETEGFGGCVVVGVPIRFENRLYNCGAILSQGHVKALIPKSYLPNYSEFL